MLLNCNIIFNLLNPHHKNPLNSKLLMIGINHAYIDRSLSATSCHFYKEF